VHYWSFCVWLLSTGPDYTQLPVLPLPVSGAGYLLFAIRGFSCLNVNAGPSRGWGRGVSYHGPRDIWGTPPSPRNIKCTRMHHFERKNSKIFFQEGPHKNVWGPTRMFSRAPLWLLMGLHECAVYGLFFTVCCISTKFYCRGCLCMSMLFTLASE